MYQGKLGTTPSSSTLDPLTRCLFLPFLTPCVCHIRWSAIEGKLKCGYFYNGNHVPVSFPTDCTCLDSLLVGLHGSACQWHQATLTSLCILQETPADTNLILMPCCTQYCCSRKSLCVYVICSGWQAGGRQGHCFWHVSNHMEDCAECSESTAGPLLQRGDHTAAAQGTESLHSIVSTICRQTSQKALRKSLTTRTTAPRIYRSPILADTNARTSLCCISCRWVVDSQSACFY